MSRTYFVVRRVSGTHGACLSRLSFSTQHETSYVEVTSTNERGTVAAAAPRHQQERQEQQQHNVHIGGGHFRVQTACIYTSTNMRLQRTCWQILVSLQRLVSLPCKKRTAIPGIFFRPCLFYRDGFTVFFVLFRQFFHRARLIPARKTTATRSRWLHT